MSTNPQVHRAAHAVLDHLADQVTPGPQVRDHTAWRRRVRNQLRTRHWPTLLAILTAEHPDQIATIARLLEAPPTSSTDPHAGQQAALQQRITEDATRFADTAAGVPMPSHVRHALDRSSR